MNSLASARSELVLASRLADRTAPIDGVTTSVKDPDLVRADAARACEFGFSGKLLIHPAQIAPAMEGFRPSDDDVATITFGATAGVRGAAKRDVIDGGYSSSGRCRFIGGITSSSSSMRLVT